MKKFVLLTLFLLANTAYAQTEFEIFDIDDLANYIENEETPNENRATVEQSARKDSDGNSNSSYDLLQKHFADKDDAQKAQNDAGRLLERQPNILELRDSQKRLIKEGEQKRLQFIKSAQKNNDNSLDEENSEKKQNEKLEQEIKQIAQKHNTAPFGLFWGINKEQTELLGFVLQSAERKDYQNVYKVDNPKQSVKTFDTVTAIFGEQNKLWCIFAQSTPQKDTPQASEVLKLYRKYYDALELKYGHAKQYFTPHTHTEEIINEGASEPQKETVTITDPIGNDNFLAELQNGTAVLYATFENDIVGITLGVSVDGDAQSYISLDYKNLKIMDEEMKTKLDNLINDI